MAMKFVMDYRLKFRMDEHKFYRFIPKCSGVYVIKNTRTKMKYIGHSQNLQDRLRSWYTSFKPLKLRWLEKSISGNVGMKEDMKKYPSRYWTCEVIYLCETKEEAEKKEIELIKAEHFMDIYNYFHTDVSIKNKDGQLFFDL